MTKIRIHYSKEQFGKPLIGLFIGVVIFLVGIFLKYVLFPTIIADKVAEKITISTGSSNYKRWVDLPQPLKLQVHFFNILNPEQVHNGEEKPVVKEVGPYIYRYHHSRKNIEFSLNGETVKFDDQAKIIFDRDATNASLSDTDDIYIANPILIGTSQMSEIKEQSAQMSKKLATVFNNPQTAFVKTTPREILFEGMRFCNNGGGSDVISRFICTSMKRLGSNNIQQDGDDLLFSFFGHKNRYLDGKYEVFTGKMKAELTHVIKSKNNNPLLTVWGEEGVADTCNKIRGTDTLSFPPLRKPYDSITAFSNDICRPVDIYYEGEVEYKSKRGFRYFPRSNFLKNIGPEFGNECYCVNNTYNKDMIQNNGCLYSGALDLTKCLSAPLILTNPHMYETHEIYTSTVIGQNPNREKHFTYIDVEPYTGVPLRGGKRVQFNIFLRPINNMSFFENYQPALVPIMWVEEGAELNNEMIRILEDEFYNSLSLTIKLVWIILACGTAICFIMILRLCCKIWKLNKKSEILNIN